MLSLRQAIPEYHPPIPFPSFPSARLSAHYLLKSSFRWLLQVYTKDVWSRLPQLCATATSVYGKIIKIDSTKKVCKKLAGAAAGTAAWVTNVSNEKGEVLISVVTASEALPALKPMGDGLMKRSVGLVIAILIIP